MSYPPSIHSPEYFKPQKPENHACCGGACGVTPEQKVIQKRGCFIRYKVGGNANYKTGGSSSCKVC